MAEISAWLDKSDLSKSLKGVRLEWPNDNYPFSEETVPIEIQAVGKRLLEEYALKFKNKALEIRLKLLVNTYNL